MKNILKSTILFTLLLSVVILFSCKKEEPDPIDNRTIPTVFMYAPTNLQTNSAEISAQVSEDGGAAVTERGFCYATTVNPTIENNKIIVGQGKGTYNHSLTGLQHNTRYYVKAYAINVKGIAYSPQINFTTQNITK